MDVSFQLSERAIRIIKSYQALSGKAVADISLELGELVSGVLEVEIKRRIGSDLGFSEVPVSMAEPVDSTGISEGLGDEDETPAVFGVTDADLAADMVVEDPQHEAKAEAPAAIPVTADAEDTFANVAGFVVPPVTRRAGRRKKVIRGKGKVSPMSAGENESAP